MREARAASTSQAKKNELTTKAASVDFLIQNFDLENRILASQGKTNSQRFLYNFHNIQAGIQRWERLDKPELNQKYSLAALVMPSVEPIRTSNLVSKPKKVAKANKKGVKM